MYGAYKKMSFWDEKEVEWLFQKLPFYNVLIEKPRIKRLKNIDLLHELLFYNELSIEKVSDSFKRYARSYKIEIKDLKDPLARLVMQTQRKWRHRIWSCLF